MKKTQKVLIILVPILFLFPIFAFAGGDVIENYVFSPPYCVFDSGNKFMQCNIDIKNIGKTRNLVLATSSVAMIDDYGNKYQPSGMRLANDIGVVWVEAKIESGETRRLTMDFKNIARKISTFGMNFKFKNVDTQTLPPTATLFNVVYKDVDFDRPSAPVDPRAQLVQGVAMAISDSLTGVKRITPEQIKNQVYNSIVPYGNRSISFNDGKYDYGKFGDEDYITASLDKIWIGDVNNDTVEEAVTVMVSNGGGSGVFYDVIYFVNKGGNYIYSSGYSLGDRPVINNIKLHPRKIELDVTVHGPNDAMCCPTNRKIIDLVVDPNGVLVESRR